MEKQSVILVTGAAGFIGSCVVQFFNEQGKENIILVDKFANPLKESNWKHKKYKHLVDRELLLDWLDESKPNIEFVIHLGARTNKKETDNIVLRNLNTEYSEDIWNYCTAFNIPLIYSSTAATYGNGELGFDDDNKMIFDLKPLDACAASKHEFDKWAIRQLNAPPCWAGLKFFDVYGPNEYHKEEMASLVLQAFKQIKAHDCVKLFKSNNGEIGNGEQLRDFVYVKDIAKVIWWMYNAMVNKEWQADKNGFYNVGTGKARTLNDVAKVIFKALQKQPHLIYVDTPADAVNSYTYSAEAATVKLKHAGCEHSFYSLEEGIDDYIKNYLLKNAVNMSLG